MTLKNGKRLLAIIPARFGSVRLPRKNILPFANKPLMAWTILEAQKVTRIDSIIVSTESSTVQNIASNYGVQVPYLRSLESAGDHATSFQVISEVINQNKGYDSIILLQPTSPLRSYLDIDLALDIFEDFNSPVVSLYKSHENPFWSFRIGKEGRIESMFPEKLRERSQDLPTTYTLNGAIYIDNISDYLKCETFLRDETLGYIMDEESSIDIDTKEDFDRAEAIKFRRLTE
jgi:CMP-N-acetylneuraminic acid synthetase